jgi:uncharacterized protein YpmS
MWKRAFIVLLSINLVIAVFAIAWLNTFPKSATVPKANTDLTEKAANVQLAIGEDAINTYLEYALAEQPDVKQIFSYARVGLSNTWDCDVGIKLTDRVVPFHLTLSPNVQAGNVALQIDSAAIGGIPVPTSLLMLVLKHAPWPYWISLDLDHQAIDVDFTKRTPHPYGVKILGYSPTTKLLTLMISIVPKSAVSSLPG